LLHWTYGPHINETAELFIQVDFYKFTFTSTQVVLKRFTSTQVQTKSSSVNPAYILIDLTARAECALGIVIKQLKAKMK